MPNILLSSLTGTSEIDTYINQHISNNIKDKLTFVKNFKNGKQGIVSLYKIADIDQYVVLKLSQDVNYLSQHEYRVMLSLNPISDYCHNFIRVFNIFRTEVDRKHKKNIDPLIVSQKNPIEQDVILYQYLDNSKSFYKYIKSKKIEDSIIFSTIKQTLLSLYIAQQKCKLTHYDLHSCNIMMKQCDPNLVFLYVLNSDIQICIPSFGHYPVIIDYGFSYTNTLNDTPLYSSLAHTEMGFTSYTFNWVTDPKLFLTSVLNDILIHRQHISKVNKFRNIVNTMFKDLHLDKESGWDICNSGKSVAEQVLDVLNKHNTCSSIFKKDGLYCIDIIQSLIILPIHKQEHKDIGISCNTFLTEFSKFENLISNPIHILYILRCIVDIAREVRNDYLIESSRTYALTYFKNTISEIISHIAKYVIIKHIHWEKLLCSLYYLSTHIEGLMYELISKYNILYKKKTDKLIVQNILDIYELINHSIQDIYTYQPSKTNVFIIDNINEKSDIMSLSDLDCNIINRLDNYQQSSYLYELYKSNQN